jgi:hypothetical protein
MSSIIQRRKHAFRALVFGHRLKFLPDYSPRGIDVPTAFCDVLNCAIYRHDGSCMGNNASIALHVDGPTRDRYVHVTDSVLVAPLYRPFGDH